MKLIIGRLLHVDPAAAPPSADKRGGRGTLDRPAAKVPFGTIAGRTSPLLRSAAAAISACRSAFSRLAQSASRHRWPACRARQHPLGPQPASACQDNAVLPYIRHYGSYWRHAGGCARRPENGPRDVRFGAHAPPIRVPRQVRDLLGRPGPVAMRRPRREHAFRRPASGAGSGWEATPGHSRSHPHARRTPTACLRRGGDTRPAHSGNRRPAAQQLPAVTAHAW